MILVPETRMAVSDGICTAGTMEKMAAEKQYNAVAAGICIWYSHTISINSLPKKIHCMKIGIR